MGVLFWRKRSIQVQTPTPESMTRPLRIETLESRDLLVSNVIPGTLLPGPSETTPFVVRPPFAEGAAGEQFLVDVTSANGGSINWRSKDGSSTGQVTISTTAFFNNVPLQVDGTPIVSSTGQVLTSIDPGVPDGVALPDGAQQQAFFSTFFVSTISGGFTTPGAVSTARVLYDQYWGRFVVAANNDTEIVVAVSVDENPNDGWYLYSIDTTYNGSLVGRDADGNLVDPGAMIIDNLQIGLTRDSITFTVNTFITFNDVVLVPAVDSNIYALTKQDFYEGFGGTTTYTTPERLDYGVFNLLSPTDHLDITPVHNYGVDDNSAFFIEMSPRGAVNSALSYRFDFINSSVSFFREGPVVLNGLSLGYTRSNFDGQDALARGDESGPVAIDINSFGQNGGSSATSAVWRANPQAPRSGVGSLWVAHTLISPVTNRAQVRWYEIRVSTTEDPAQGEGDFLGGVLVQQGGVDTHNLDATGTPMDTYAPAITVDRNNNMAVAFAGSNINTYISAFYSGKFDRDRVLGLYEGTTRPSRVLAWGTDLYTRQGSFTGVLWGPFSGVAVDPTDDETFWTFNAYATDRPTGNLFGAWATTWGAFVLVPDNLIFAVDVSSSMNRQHNLDVNGDGNVNNQDDINKDGFAGTPLDLAIAEILRSYALGILPGQQEDGKGVVSLIIFGGSAGAVRLNVNVAGMSGYRINPTADNDGDGVPDFIEALLSIRIGSAGIITETTVGTSPTLYAPALQSIVDLDDKKSVSQAAMYSDGGGRLPEDLVRNASALYYGMRIDTVTVGSFQTVGYTGDFELISATTGGTTATVENDPNLNPLPPTLSGAYDGGFVPPAGISPLNKPFPSSLLVYPGTNGASGGTPILPPDPGTIRYPTIIGFPPTYPPPPNPTTSGTADASASRSRPTASSVDAALEEDVL